MSHALNVMKTTMKTQEITNYPGILDEVYDLIRHQLHLENFVIGGGMVRDALRNSIAKDIDVFVLDDGTHKTFTEAKEDILERTKSLPFIESKIEWHKSEPFLVKSFSNAYGDVQVMARNINTVEELLDTFDWNVSLFAFDGKRVYARESVEEIGVGKELKLQACTYPVSTLRRGFRFSERYTMKFNKSDIVFLCNKILEKQETGV